MTLTDFLLARIAEDEATARAVMTEAWHGIEEISTGDDPWPSERAFAERFTIPRDLAECEAKRRIVKDLALPYIAERRRLMGGQPSWDDENPTLLLLLALPYADHPDYDEAWKP